jgi:predicted nucleic acid-binding protein
MNDKIFFDTNLLIYLYSEDEPEKQSKLLNLVKNHENRWISTQVLNELSNTLRRKFKLEYSEIENIVAEISAKFQIAVVQVQTIESAFKIAADYRYSYYDSLIIATALELSCQFLYSEDMQHGQLIKGQMRIFNPLV